MNHNTYFYTYNENWTRIPNVLIDDLVNPKVTINQTRLILYLIRNTIGYNKDSKWKSVTRNELIKNAGIPNGRIKSAIEGCLDLGWILVYEDIECNLKERYIFLNDEINQRILIGLRNSLFKIANLKHMNISAIDRLLDQHNIIISKAYQSKRELDAEVPTIKQEEQIDSINVLQIKFKNRFKKNLSKQTAKTLLDLAKQYSRSIDECMDETFTRFELNQEPINNPVGALRYAIETGWDIKENGISNQSSISGARQAVETEKLLAKLRKNK